MSFPAQGLELITPEGTQNYPGDSGLKATSLPALQNNTFSICLIVRNNFAVKDK
jgi:hypothetical protein